MDCKRILTLAVVMLFALSVVAKKDVPTYVVSGVKGKVERITQRGKLLLKKGDVLDQDAVLNLPFDGSVTLLKEGDNKQYIINSPGKAKISSLVNDGRNTVITLTKEYVKSVIGQLRSNSTVKAAYHSDPATVTREKMEADSVRADSCKADTTCRHACCSDSTHVKQNNDNE
ncbi:MAG: hypothetical protein IJ614_08670 [Prevotella sp.]|nr:hypothetical protein [Prevotella sp.]